MQKMYGKLETDIALANGFKASQWVVYVAEAPATPSQTEVASRMTLSDGTSGRRVGEVGGEGRALLMAQSSAPALSNGARVTAEYWATLHSRHLSEESSPQAVTPLSSEEQVRYLQSTVTNDFLEPDFSNWLVANNLVRGQNEPVMEFAWRIFEFLRTHYKYSYQFNQDRSVSHLCKETSTDCGGSSYLFVSVMRRNGIPARCLVGRNARSSAHVEESRTDVTGTFHVKAEFYSPDIGWVPVDIARAMQLSEERAEKFFGNENGDFLVMHIDNDFVLQSILFGDKNVRGIQKCKYWVKGKGSYDSSTKTVWMVTKTAVSK